MYKHRMNTVMLQLEEVERERDQVRAGTRIPSGPEPGSSSSYDGAWSPESDSHVRAWSLIRCAAAGQLRPVDASVCSSVTWE